MEETQVSSGLYVRFALRGQKVNEIHLRRDPKIYGRDGFFDSLDVMHFHRRGKIFIGIEEFVKSRREDALHAPTYFDRSMGKIIVCLDAERFGITLEDYADIVEMIQRIEHPRGG